ncbi:hypothetical protein SteCoe_22543 [Stentor coeruleus]|uniref:Uncharacterized protein n=1 Tax=Stentor coeruleus TaxID=5963 RepID=A0A1R2BLT1_9CILI|nr:hypothetical protein SteCoe_22543 [Stentor coeruleus]
MNSLGYLTKKSDIETILESQTWKTMTPKKTTRPKPLILPKLKEVELLTEDSPIVKVPDSKPSFLMEPMRRKSLLAIPVGQFTARIKNLIIDEDMNYARIPLLPKYPFGKHIEMLSKEPEFKILPKEVLTNTETIKNLKIESGRIKRTITTSPSIPIIKKKKKSNKHLKILALAKSNSYLPLNFT